jgi:hypothetical protein
MMEALYSFETSVLIIAAPRNIPEDGILQEFTLVPIDIGSEAHIASYSTGTGTLFQGIREAVL